MAPGISNLATAAAPAPAGTVAATAPPGPAAFLAVLDGCLEAASAREPTRTQPDTGLSVLLALFGAVPPAVQVAADLPEADATWGVETTAPGSEAAGTRPEMAAVSEITVAAAGAAYPNSVAAPETATPLVAVPAVLPAGVPRPTPVAARERDEDFPEPPATGATVSVQPATVAVPVIPTPVPAPAVPAEAQPAREPAPPIQNDSAARHAGSAPEPAANPIATSGPVPHAGPQLAMAFGARLSDNRPAVPPSGPTWPQTAAVEPAAPEASLQPPPAEQAPQHPAAPPQVPAAVRPEAVGQGAPASPAGLAQSNTEEKPRPPARLADAAPAATPEAGTSGPQSAAGKPPTAPPQPVAEAESRAARPHEPVRDIALRVPGHDEKVEIRMAERAGEIRVSVHAADGALRRDLQEHLPELVRGLAHQGFAAEAWRATESSWRSGAGDRGAQDAPSEGGGGGAHQDGRGRRRDAEPAWRDEIGRSLSGDDESERSIWQISQA